MKTAIGILFLLLAGGAGHAGELEMVGVLANSGEQGATLARFEGDDAERNVGVVYSPDGSIWTGGAEGELLRYAVDGRLLGVYPVPRAQSRTKRYRPVLCGDSIVIQVGEILYRLPIDAEAGTEPVSMDVEVDNISLSSHEGWLAAAKESRIFWVNPQGETKPIGETGDNVHAIEVGPEGEIYVQLDNDMRRRRAFIQMDEPENELPLAGMFPQWIDGNWYLMNYHGTVLRFDRQLEADPGVAIGGNSGAFIGYVPGNYELGRPTGVAWLGGDVFAIKGVSGLVYLMEWDPQSERFTLVRRIGPLPDCEAIAMDSRGRIWVNGGVLQWNDAPDAPFEHGIPGAGAERDGRRSVFGVETLPSDAYVAALQGPGQRELFLHGTMDGPAKGEPPNKLIQESYVATCLIRWGNNRPALLMVDKTGEGTAVYVSSTDGKPSAEAGKIRLEGSTPIRQLTSLASDGEDRIWAAADGHVIAFARDGNVWKERNRRQGNSAIGLGEELHLGFSDNLLWVSDTDRHRVMVFDAVENRMLGQFGELDSAGAGLETLSLPRAIAAQGNRAVVFDSGNQRLIKLQWID